MERYRYDDNTQSIMENSRIPFAIYQFINNRIVIIALSAGFCDLFGFKSKAQAYEFMNKDMYHNTHNDDIARISEAAYNFAAKNSEYNVVYRVKLHNMNNYIVIHAQGERMQTDGNADLAVVWYTNEGIYSEKNDYDDRSLNGAFSHELHSESLFHESLYDSLTGLPNMAHFFRLAEYELETISQPVMLFLDMNGMRSFNRKYGFEEGDKLIHEASKLLKSYFGNENCSRFGQDHFAALTSGDNIEQTLQKLFGDFKSINNGKSLSLRMGIYPFSIESIDISAACDRAKMACDSKRSIPTSSYAYFDNGMLIDALNKQYIIDNLDKALDEKWIQVYYQPIIRTSNGKICDEEALSRWFDPEKGMISPEIFVPVLEDSLLIYKLDLYVIDQVLEKLKKQEATGIGIVPASVNLSRSDFDACDIVEEVRKRVDSSGIKREFLKIEITESVIGSDFEYMKTQVERFRSLGFHVWMDDFGNGYSSLDVLQSIQFDLIKFNMRFMQQFDNTDRSKIILTELMKMALGLGVSTIAEGVERKEQLDFLSEIGCTKVQGFYFSKPVPYETIIKRFQTNVAIGFENLAEKEYFTAIGALNLYDPNAIANEDGKSFKQYFSTLPMAILESNGDDVKIIRCNKSMREFIHRTFEIESHIKEFKYSEFSGKIGRIFFKSLKECELFGSRSLILDAIDRETKIHLFIRRIAVNPVTKAAAIAVVVLEVINSKH